MGKTSQSQNRAGVQLRETKQGKGGAGAALGPPSASQDQAWKRGANGRTVGPGDRAGTSLVTRDLAGGEKEPGSFPERGPTSRKPMPDFSATGSPDFSKTGVPGLDGLAASCGKTRAMPLRISIEDGCSPSSRTEWRSRSRDRVIPRPTLFTVCPFTEKRLPSPVQR